MFAISVLRNSMIAAVPLLGGCGGGDDASAGAGTTTTSTTPSTSATTGPEPTTAAATGTTTGEAATGPGTTTGTTGPEITGTSTSTDESSGSTGMESTGEPACEDLPEICDALDNNCNGGYDEGCNCTPPDLELKALDGYTARVIVDVPNDIGAYGRTGEVERAVGEYWGMPGEGVLFSVNNAGNTGSGIGLLDQDGAFFGWLLDPDEAKLPPHTYMEYGYGGVLYVCSTEVGDWIFKVFPDGVVEPWIHHGECEGLMYGDRGDGQIALYASEWAKGEVYHISEAGERTLLAVDLFVVTDLGIPRPGSAFKTGLYAINQKIGGVNRIAPDNTVTLEYPYDLGFGVGEEMNFADPKSAFRDHFYHLSSTLQAVVRVKPDGTWEKILEGPKLNYGLHTVGGAFSSNGAFYFFTNEEALIMRLQGCDIGPG